MYRFDTSTLHLRAASFAVIILLLLLLGLYLVFLVFRKGLETTHGARLTFRQLPVQMKILVCVPLLVLAVVAGLLIRLDAVYLSYEYRMSNDRGERVEGAVELIASEEDWYRDSFLGYTIEFQVGEVTLAPSNSFPKEILDAFEEGGTYRIVYGYMGDELCVWSVDRINP